MWLDQVTKMMFEIDSVVRGYHVYKNVWDTHIGTELPCIPESNNPEDCYAVAVMDGDVVVGHVPRKVSFSYLQFAFTPFCNNGL